MKEKKAFLQWGFVLGFFCLFFFRSYLHEILSMHVCMSAWEREKERDRESVSHAFSRWETTKGTEKNSLNLYPLDIGDKKSNSLFFLLQNMFSFSCLHWILSLIIIVINKLLSLSIFTCASIQQCISTHACVHMCVCVCSVPQGLQIVYSRSEHQGLWTATLQCFITNNTHLALL